MCTMGQCRKSLGKWVQFQTQWGMHRGIVREVTPRGVLISVPRQYAPVGLASHAPIGASDEMKLDIALTAYPGYGYSRYGYPGYGGYGGGWGYPGYGAWYGGWWWWWLAFAWIFWLAFLW